MNPRRFWQSFKDAKRGIGQVFKSEQNFRIQTAAAVLALSAAIFFGLSRSEFVLVIFLVVAVIILELINSAVEKFADLLKPRLSHQIEVVKDIMAGVVFLAAIGALVIGLIIFWPYLLALI